MLTTPLALLAAALGVPNLPAEAARPPATPAPTFRIVSSVDPVKGEVRSELTRTVPVTVQRQVVETVNQNGQNVQVARTVTVTEMRTQKVEVAWALKNGKALDGAGKPIDEKELFKRVKNGDVVLFADGDAVDPAWLRVLKPEAVILLNRVVP